MNSRERRLALRDEVRQANPKPHFVYVASTSFRPGQVKIGRTTNPNQRIRGLRYSVARDMRFLGYWRVTDSFVTESNLHALFGNFYVTREWFQFDGNDAVTIVTEHLGSPNLLPRG